MSAHAAPRGEHRGGRGLAVVASAVVFGMVASGLLVWKGTQAVFSGTTNNASNSWTAGTVTLTNDATNYNSGTGTGNAMFTVSGMVPGDSGSNCLTINYTGNVLTAVKLYATSVSDAGSMAQYLTLTVQEGTGGGYGNCTGFTPSVSGQPIYNGDLSTFDTTKTNYSSGVGTWAPSSASSTVYKFSWTFSSSAPSSIEGASTSTTFKWEAQAGH